jgi:glycine/D-amino acid oxidase-like deaminating enzyme
VAGKRMLRSWGLDHFLPAALHTYQVLEEEFRMQLLRETSILQFPATAEEATLFAIRAAEEETFLSADVQMGQLQSFFEYYHTPGRIAPAWSLNTTALLGILRERLLQTDVLREEAFDWSALEMAEDGIRYQDVAASHLICCEGWAGMHNTYFRNLPFSPAKGEALILSIPSLPRDTIYKHGMTLAPWGGDLFWLGSSYDWNFTDAAPTAVFRQKAEALLKAWLKLPYQVVDHRAAVRPATVGQRPFVGVHPVHQHMAILNGLGAKGVLMAPLLAENLVAHLTAGEALMPEVDVMRHRRVLMRG